MLIIILKTPYLTGMVLAAQLWNKGFFCMKYYKTVLYNGYKPMLVAFQSPRPLAVLFFMTLQVVLNSFFSVCILSENDSAV